MVGPIKPPSEKGQKYMMTVTDYFSKWPERSKYKILHQIPSDECWVPLRGPKTLRPRQRIPVHQLPLLPLLREVQDRKRGVQFGDAEDKTMITLLKKAVSKKKRASC